MSKDPATQKLLDIMVALRNPETGCAWDVKQTFETVAPYTLEEAYEVADAIMRNNPFDLKEELGDLLLQVVFHARIAEEQGLFSFSDVVEAISDKMIRRHPHVFGNPPIPAKDLHKQWDTIKEEEKLMRLQMLKDAGRDDLLPSEKGFLNDVPYTLPALSRADKLTKRAAQVKFDWPDTHQVLAKIREELEEVEEALAQHDASKTEEEIGDLLFAVANLARHAKISPETALQKTNEKFKRRFAYIEKFLGTQNKSLQDSSLEEMEVLWNEAKKHENTNH